MSKFIRGTVLSGVVASLLLVPAMGAAQGRTSVKVGKDGSVEVKTGNTSVKADGSGVDTRTGGTVVEARDTVVEAQDEDEDAQGGEEAAGAQLEISSSGNTETHRCSPKTEVSISGSENEITLTGECKSVSVSGADNKVKVEAVGTITVVGSGNEVLWKKAVGGKKPKVSRTGVDNKVAQAR
jgi:DUF3060 family protein